MSPSAVPRGAVRAGVLVAAALVLVVLAGGPAAAAPELRLSPASGPPGSPFTVTGTGFPAAEVEIHWAAESGPRLATATGPDFSVEVTVPDAATNSYPVVAVVRQGNAVSTSTAAYQVTPGTEADPAPTTTTTVEVTTPTAVTAAPALGADGPSRNSAVTGGLDPAMVDTTNGSEGPGAVTGSGAPLAAAGAAAAAGGSATTTTSALGGPAAAVGAPVGATAPLPPGVADAGAPVPGAGGGTEPPPARAADASGSALGPRPTSQSSGAAGNPPLLFVGLAMVFGAGGVLAVRNHRRTGASSG